MPYSSIKELPPNLDNLPTGAKRIFLKVFNENYSKGESSARKIAWAAVKNSYKKDENGNWIAKMNLPQELINIYSLKFKNIYSIENDKNKAKESAWQEVLSKFDYIDGQWINKSQIASFEIVITKANLDSNGKMTFNMSASDIIPDSFGEMMSISLYKSFIERIDGKEFVSLSHYPRLKNELGVLGYIGHSYIDGSRLKLKGYFSDNKLGLNAYNAIRKDRRDNVSFEKRIRVSIGFYDYAHQHDNYIWRISDNKPCEICENMNKSGKVYLNGKLDHAALTRVPALKSTDIELEG